MTLKDTLIQLFGQTDIGQSTLVSPTRVLHHHKRMTRQQFFTTEAAVTAMNCIADATKCSGRQTNY